MRGLLGLNKTPETKPKNQDDASRQNTEEKTNEDTKSTMAPENTELTIQIIFTAAVVAAHFLSFHTLHIAALILLFKCITNFPKERNQKIRREHTPPHPKISSTERRRGNWRRRKKKRAHSWKYTKYMAKLVMATLIAMDMTDNIAKHSDPETPIHTLKKLLYSLAFE